MKYTIQVDYKTLQLLKKKAEREGKELQDMIEEFARGES